MASPPPPPVAPARGAWSAFALLLVINLFNYIDRQVLSAVLAKIKLDPSMLDPADPWIQTKLGLLTSAFMVSYMVLAPIFGWLDGRGLRRWVILGIGVTGWSVASGCSGLAGAYWVFLLTRCFVGIGEGAYGPVASAMLADIFPQRLRGTVIAVFNMAIPIGSALGFVLGGWLGAKYGWRSAFLFTLSGLILGVLCFMRREFPRTIAVEQRKPKYREVLKSLVRNRSYLLCCVGMTAVTFVMGGLASWLPVYVFEREARFQLSPAAVEKLRAGADFLRADGSPVVPAEVTAKLAVVSSEEVQDVHAFRMRVRDSLGDADFKQYSEWVLDAAAADGSVTTSDIGLYFGVILVLAGLTATPAGTFFAWLLGKRFGGANFLVSGIGALVGFPLAVAFLFLPFPFAWVAVFGAVFALFVYTGPMYTMLANVTTPEVRATAFAWNILLIHALGDAISPTILGGIADASNLHTSFLMSSVLLVVGGVIWLWGARYEGTDTARAGEATPLSADPAAPPKP